MPNKNLLNAQLQIRKNLKRYQRSMRDLGTLAFIGRHDGVVSVPGRSGYIYVRYGDTPAIEVFNKRVAPMLSIPVFVGYDPLEPNLFQVLSTAISTPEYATSAVIPMFTSPHNASHLYGGGDPVFLEKRQLLPSRIGPSAASSLLLDIYPDVVYNGAVVDQIAHQSVDLTRFVPGSGSSCYVLITETSGSVSVTPGSTVLGTTPAITDIPTAPGGAMVMGAVRLYGGMTGINDNTSYSDIVDLRTLLAPAGGIASAALPYVLSGAAAGAPSTSRIITAGAGIGISTASAGSIIISGSQTITGSAAYATNSGSSLWATNAGSAIWSGSAGTSASCSGSALYATNAGSALWSGSSGTSASCSGSALYATNSGSAAFAPGIPDINNSFLTSGSPTADLVNARQLKAGTNITLDATTPGQLTIIAASGSGGSGSGGAGTSEPYITHGIPSGLTDYRKLLAGTGITFTDSGSTITVAGSANIAGSAAYATNAGYAPPDPTGWIPMSGSLAFSSADAPTFVLTAAGVPSNIYSAGMRLKYTQSGSDVYGIITATTGSTITFYGGTDYTTGSAAITAPYYSMVKSPFGFPTSPAKWTVETTDTANERSQDNALTGVWYNIQSLTISIPIGIWDVSYYVTLYIAVTNNYGLATLSTANNSESNAYFTSMQAICASQTHHRNYTLSLVAKTTYYLNEATIGDTSSIYLENNRTKLLVRAVCAYL